MSQETHRVQEVARLARVTVRTLHHYDAIGLLVPSGRTAAGHRLYDGDDLARLLQIRTFRELGLSLQTIARLLRSSTEERVELLSEHRRELLAEGRRLQSRLRAVDTTLATLRGESTMSPENLFEGFDPAEYEDEARERWGDTPAYAEAARRTARYGREQWKRIHTDDAAILQALAERMASGVPATDPTVVELAERHRRHIDLWFYPCSTDAHRGLAEMYVADPRFTAQFDRRAEGLAAYLAEAIRCNADRSSETE